jgi:hypothetical protein
VVESFGGLEAVWPSRSSLVNRRNVPALWRAPLGSAGKRNGAGDVATTAEADERRGGTASRIEDYAMLGDGATTRQIDINGGLQ